MLEKTLEERNNTHGDFGINAMISQELKEYFAKYPGWDTLSDVQKESLDMFALKLSRILSGMSNEPDHWRDIAGYAMLVVNDLEKGDT